MLKSKFVASILDLLLDGDVEGLLARKQIPYLTEGDQIEYTGIGAFYGFKTAPGIEKFRVEKAEPIILSGVEIKSPELEIGADATLFFDRGIISSLEIWSYSGEYPQHELTSYSLEQVWTVGVGRKVEVY